MIISFSNFPEVPLEPGKYIFEVTGTAHEVITQGKVTVHGPVERILIQYIGPLEEKK